jgi:hypothetical protein
MYVGGYGGRGRAYGSRYGPRLSPQGTGSTPPFTNGLQRARRHAVSAVPGRKPRRRRASSA